MGGSSRRGNGSNEIVLKEKVSLTIKETLNRDAQSVSSIAIRSSSFMKRNEQGNQTYGNSYLNNKGNFYTEFSVLQVVL